PLAGARALVCPSAQDSESGKITCQTQPDISLVNKTASPHAAEEIERQELEGAQHQERAGAEHEATEGLGPVEQTRHPEEVVPVVDEPVGEQRQRHRAAVGRV